MERFNDNFGDIEFIRMISAYNFSKRASKIKYIVIHDTGNVGNGADAIAHGKYFCSRKLSASAHYFVDEKSIVQVVEDYNASWHCGDGRNRFGINNANSISIEICVNQDGIYEKSFENAAKLTSYLMQKYFIGIDNVVRHYDASRKLCPRSMAKDNWALWKKFLEKIKKFPQNQN